MSKDFLIIAAEEWIPYVIVQEASNDTAIFSGVMMEVLSHLSRSMNFTYKMVRPPDGKWGIKEPNGSWNGMVGMLHRGEADLALGPMGVTHERATVCDFTVPLFIDEWSILMAAPEIQADPLVMLKPFDFLTWTGLMLALAGVVLTFVVMDMKFSGQTWHMGTPRVIGFATRVLFSEGPIWTPERWNHERVLAICWLFAMLVLSQSYSGTLVSIFAVPTWHVPVNSLEELASQKSIPWAIESGTVMESFSRSATEGSYLRKIYDEAAEFFVNCRANKASVINGQFAAFCIVSDISAILSQDFTETGRCNLVFAQETFLPLNMAIGLQKNSPLLREVDRQLLSLLQSGFVDQGVNSHLPNLTQCFTRSAVRASKIAQRASLSLEFFELTAIFVLTGACLVVAAGIFTLEVLSKRGTTSHVVLPDTSATT